MVIIKDPDWYLLNQNKPDKIYSNLIFLFISIYYFFNKNLLLGSLFIFLALASTTFHISTNRETLLLDRIAMIFIFSYFFNLFYPSISFFIFSILGILTVMIWYKTEELFFFFLFQLVGILLFLFYYRMNIYYKLIIIISYISITYSQLLKKGKYHSLKHIALGILSLFLKA